MIRFFYRIDNGITLVDYGDNKNGHIIEYVSDTSTTCLIGVLNFPDNRGELILVI